MSLQPSVTLVCLTADRDEMLERAIRCWRAQSYPCNLLVYDNGTHKSAMAQVYWGIDGIGYKYEPRCLRTIGQLRNAANALATTDIIAHLDSDDWSHPRRIEEQVKLLTETGADVVGYNEALFWWRQPIGPPLMDSSTGQIRPAMEGQSWLYNHGGRQFCLGTSLCYWRRVWEKKPFQALPSSSQSAGEDWVFCAGLNALGVTSMVPMAGTPILGLSGVEYEPRLIASVSERLATGMSRPEPCPEWRRAPEWDAYCRAVMEGK